MARTVLVVPCMTESTESRSSTFIVTLHVVLVSTLVVGLIAAMVVVMLTN
jgi:hypothetical protein